MVLGLAAVSVTDQVMPESGLSEVYLAVRGEVLSSAGSLQFLLGGSWVQLRQ